MLFCVRGRPLLVAGGHGVDDDFGVTFCWRYKGCRGNFCGAEDAKLDGRAVGDGDGGGKGEGGDPFDEGCHQGCCGLFGYAPSTVIMSKKRRVGPCTAHSLPADPFQLKARPPRPRPLRKPTPRPTLSPKAPRHPHKPHPVCTPRIPQRPRGRHSSPDDSRRRVRHAP